jgi:hypothetical protein
MIIFYAAVFMIPVQLDASLLCIRLCEFMLQTEKFAASVLRFTGD